MAVNPDQIIKGPSHRSTKKVRLFMGETCPLHTYCQKTENLSYMFENRCRKTLEGRETSIAYCSVYGESFQFDQCFRPLFSYFAIMKFL